jgi:anti-sigma factor RsiW
MSSDLDGELGTAGRDGLAAHLGRCEACRAELARLARVHALFAGAERYEPRAGLALRVFAAVRSSQPARWSPFPATLRVLARAAVLTAVVALGVASGNLLAGAPGPASAPSPSALPSLEVFAAAPPDSPGGAYLAMVGVGHD